MDEQEKNPEEMTPDVPAEQTLPQAEEATQEESAAPEREAEAPAGEIEGTEAEKEVPGEAGSEAEAEKNMEEASDASSKEIKEGAKASPGKIVLAVAFVVVLAAALIALVVSSLGGKTEEQAPEETAASTEIQQTEAAEETAETEETVEYTIPADGNPEDVTCKGSYTAADADVLDAHDTVVATAGDYELTVGQLQVYYWMQVREFFSQYGYYLSYFGLDYTQGLDTQLCPAVEGQTWQQYFLEQALLCWQSYQAMAAEAEANGVEMSAEYQEEMDALAGDLAQSAESAGFDSVEALIAAMLGGGATYDDYAGFLNLYYQGLSYYAQVSEGFSVTDEEAEAFFDENADAYAESGISKDDVLVDVRHILIMPEGATSDTVRTETFSDEAWAASEKRAQEILEAWKKGEMTEESFAALAGEHSEDSGSVNNGGLYEDVSEGQMVTEFNDWCFDAGRQPGDFDIVKTDFGYHIMYFCQSRPQWTDYAREDLLAQMANDFLAETCDRYPLAVSYDKILLAYLDLAA